MSYFKVYILLYLLRFLLRFTVYSFVEFQEFKPPPQLAKRERKGERENTQNYKT